MRNASSTYAAAGKSVRCICVHLGDHFFRLPRGTLDGASGRRDCSLDQDCTQVLVASMYHFCVTNSKEAILSIFPVSALAWWEGLHFFALDSNVIPSGLSQVEVVLAEQCDDQVQRHGSDPWVSRVDHGFPIVVQLDLACPETVAVVLCIPASKRC